MFMKLHQHYNRGGGKKAEDCKDAENGAGFCCSNMLEGVKIMDK